MLAVALVSGCAGILGIHDPEIDPAVAGQDASPSNGEGGPLGEGGTSLDVVAAPALVVTFAGTGAQGHQDGPAGEATFGQPQSLAFDEKDLYVADAANHCIRKISLGGEVSTIDAGVVFDSPRGLAIENVGPTLYVADYGAKVVWQVIVGGATNKLLDDYGDAGEPSDLLFDLEGARLLVSEEKNRRIRSISAGGGTAVTVADVDAGGPNFGPHGMAPAGKTGIYVADSAGGAIELLSMADGSLTTVAGHTSGIPTDGPGAVATFDDPSGVAADVHGVVYVSDTLNSRIRRIVTAPDGGAYVETLAGKGGGTAIDGPIDQAQFNQPRGIAVDAVGKNVFVADVGNNRIRKIMTPGPGALAIAWKRLADPAVTKYLASVVPSEGDVTGGSCSVDAPGLNHCVVNGLSSHTTFTVTVRAYAGDRVVATSTTTATPD